ncbi:MAG TPA: hypothetical protein DCM10_11840 [Xanthomarina gelatinilytica]|nr:hypothetical protein [Xanthomarina gelatinilytica]|tara:strand:+ start:4795 stop:5097 length:303 start_codon:yes stop_codon:yes gene_type:complete
MKLTKKTLIKLIKEEISNQLTEEDERQLYGATWRDSETESGGFIEIFIPGTQDDEVLEKVAADLEELGVESITDGSGPESSVLDFLRTVLLYSEEKPDLG